MTSTAAWGDASAMSAAAAAPLTVDRQAITTDAP